MMRASYALHSRIFYAKAQNDNFANRQEASSVNRDKQLEGTREFFDTVAGDWTSRYRRDASYAERLERFLNAVKARVSEHANILDFGCGSGDITLYLSQHGYRMTGYDLSDAMIAEARRSDRDGRVQWLSPADSGAPGVLPFEPASFDAIVASSVFEYLSDIDTVLNQLTRVLRPGAWLFATVLDSRRPVRLRQRWLKWAAITPVLATLLDHSRWREGAAYTRISVNLFSPESWQQQLRAAGLTPEHLRESSGPLLLLEARKA